MSHYARGQGDPARYGTRWGRAGGIALVSGALLAGMAVLASTHVLAAYVSVSSESSPSGFNTSQLVGQDVAFGVVQANIDGTTKPVLRAGFAQATLDGFCLSKTESLLGLFNVTVKVTAGDGTAGADIVANNASFDLTTIRGSTVNLEGKDQIGQAAADVTTTKTGGAYDANPLGAPTANNGKGWVAIDAARGTLTNVKGKLYSAEVQGDITLPNLSIGVGTTSGSACDDANTTVSN